MRTRDAVLGIFLVFGLVACGGGGSDEGQSSDAPTTLGPLGTPTFRTIPAVVETISPVLGAEADPSTIIGAAEPTYTIVSGDYPGLLATRFGCPWEDIANYNEILPEDFMLKKGYPGDVLNLPPQCTGQPVSGDPIVEATVDPAAAAAAPTSTAAPEVEGSSYVVEAGDALFLIATRFNTTMSAIVAANGWSDGIEHQINPGDKIKLPAPSAG